MRSAVSYTSGDHSLRSLPICLVMSCDIVFDQAVQPAARGVSEIAGHLVDEALRQFACIVHGVGEVDRKCGRDRRVESSADSYPRNRCWKAVVLGQDLSTVPAGNSGGTFMALRAVPASISLPASDQPSRQPSAAVAVGLRPLTRSSLLVRIRTPLPSGPLPVGVTQM